MTWFKEAFAELLPVIEKAAPMIASALGGPLAGTASVAVSALAKVYGSLPSDIPSLIKDIKNDSDSDTKLKNAQSLFQQSMFESYAGLLPRKLTIVIDWTAREQS
jgi:hypothetical protein